MLISELNEFVSAWNMKSCEEMRFAITLFMLQLYPRFGFMIQGICNGAQTCNVQSRMPSALAQGRR